MKSLKTCAVIPAFNEEENIGEVVRETRKYVDNVIVVDDGSTDKTFEEASDADIVLRHPVNMGKGFALGTGVEKALENGSDIFITLDGDNQHNPGDIPKLASILVDDKLDVVFGSRSLNGDMPLVLRFGNWWLCKTAQLLFGSRIEDSQTGFRAFRREAYDKIRWSSHHYSMDSEIVMNVGRNKLRHRQVPIKTHYHCRHKGTTVVDGVRIFLNMLFWRVRG
ncbi:MAG: hypothetical protein B6U72_05235 [Candidatus Altiarchaeales archaeon ex4484_2]|nr:MAG: hypothetical protein B6U72_05235 [Candidatus Altiarchaeales archaeon ex4484_2]